MPKVVRTGVRINPDSARVLIRPFFPFPRDQSLMVIARIMSLSEGDVKKELGRVLKSFADRHFSVESVFGRRYEQIRDWRFTDRVRQAHHV